MSEGKDFSKQLREEAEAFKKENPEFSNQLREEAKAFKEKNGDFAEQIRKEYEAFKKENPDVKFKPYIRTGITTDSVIVNFSNKTDYSEPLTDEIELFREFETEEITGCQIFGVMQASNEVHLIKGETSSGKIHQALAYEEPFEECLSAWAHSIDGDKNKKGSGFDGSNVHITVTKLPVTRCLISQVKKD